MGSILQLNDQIDLHAGFRESALKYARILAEEGIHVRPFRDPALPVYAKLSPDGKQRANREIELALSVFEETRAEGFRLTDSPKLIWRALRRFGWTPQSDIFDKVRDDDVIQIFNTGQKSIFQNLNFFKWVSFTLEDLYTDTWYQLTFREQDAMQRLYEIATDVVTGKRTGTFETDVPEHFCEEIGTEGLCKFHIRVAYVSPLRNDGNVAGFLAVNRCRPV